MPAIGEANVLIMASDRFEESELFGPRDILLGKGAHVTIAAPEVKDIQATVHDEPSKTIAADIAIGEASAADLATRYASSAAFVCTSDHEGFCVPVVEAMAFGLPVVALGTTAVPETVGDAGITVEVECQ